MEYASLSTGLGLCSNWAATAQAKEIHIGGRRSEGGFAAPVAQELQIILHVGSGSGRARFYQAAAVAGVRRLRIWAR